MKEIFKINSHIYKNTAVSMREPAAFSSFFRKEGIWIAFFYVIHTREKSENSASKDNPTCKTPIIDWYY